MLDEDDFCERRCFFPEEFERVSERLSPQARSLWAKTGRGEQSHLWEPLYVHMGDSGEIARLLWSKWLPRTVKKLIAQDLSDSAAESLVAWMASVHDIGKATPADTTRLVLDATCIPQCSVRSCNGSKTVKDGCHARNIHLPQPHEALFR